MRFKVRILLVVLCLGTAIAVAVAGSNSPVAADVASSDVVGAVVKTNSSSNDGAGAPEQVQTASQFDIRSIRRVVPTKSPAAGLFQSKSWYEPPPAPPRTPASLLPPPPPSAPQVPFSYIGRMVNRDEVVLFLSRNDVHYVVRVNDVLDGAYHVDKISENEAVLTYIPLNVQQTLPFGPENLRLGMSTPPSAVPISAQLQQASSSRLPEK